MQVERDNYYNAISLDFKFNKLYLIWIGCNREDTVLIDADKKVVAFKTHDQLKKFAHVSQIEITGEIFNYEIHSVQQWIIEPKERVDYLLFLDLWHLFIDVAESLNIVFSGDVKNAVRNSVYDKLFDGGGPFIAEDPNPQFSKTEIFKLRDIMQAGLELLLDNLMIKELSQ